jgi:NAD-dependent deacetylase
VGTSGMVYPVAGFPDVARRNGARVIEVNPQRTPITPLADVFVGGRAGEALPLLVEAYMKPRSS